MRIDKFPAIFVFMLVFFTSGCSSAEPNVEEQFMYELSMQSPENLAKTHYDRQYYRFYSLLGAKTPVPGADGYYRCYLKADSLKQRNDLDAAQVPFTGALPWLESFDKKSINAITEYVRRYNTELEKILLMNGMDLCYLIGR